MKSSRCTSAILSVPSVVFCGTIVGFVIRGHAGDEPLARVVKLMEFLRVGDIGSIYIHIGFNCGAIVDDKRDTYLLIYLLFMARQRQSR